MLTCVDQYSATYNFQDEYYIMKRICGNDGSDGEWLVSHVSKKIMNDGIKCASR
jgi:hypothetical protein